VERAQGRTASSTLPRRQFVRIVAAGVGAAFVRLVPADRAEARAIPIQSTRIAYRLSARGGGVCNACRNHDMNRFHRTIRAADGNRAHKGCNCAIVPHRIPVATYNKYFQHRDVYDLRWGKPVGNGPK
jgi:hypothetical protein